MDPVLFGLTSDADTNHAITHLNDAKIPFLFTDLGYPDSLASQHVAVLANSDEQSATGDCFLPRDQLHNGWASIR